MKREGSLHSMNQVLSWLREQNDRISVSVEQIPFSDLKHWSFRDGSLSHDSGNFFSIDGIWVQTNYGSVAAWHQPIINQPEIGYLGIITHEIDGILHFLMQAKVEPGNINHVQISPTLQATKSNYSRVHRGRVPPYLDYFQQATRKQILFDQLQSEQGARFLKKRNRNIMLKIDEEIPIYDNFIWLTLFQIKELMSYDNVVNMDTRTVISGIPLYGITTQDLKEVIYEEKSDENKSKMWLKSVCSLGQAKNSLDDIMLFITNFKCKYDLDVQRVPLDSVKNWIIGRDSIFHEERKFFEVIAADINIDNREVIGWTQPMIRPVQDGLCAFVCKEINGIIHFAVQGKLECGNFDVMEFAPTVQCLTGNYNDDHSRENLPFLSYVLNVPDDLIIYDALQSEEGGRFYKEQNRNMLVWADHSISEDLPDNYIWMTLNQLQMFIKYNNYINIQARNLLSVIPFG